MMSIFTKKTPLIIAGILIGIASHYVISGWFTIIPWVIITPLIGMQYRVARDAVWGGLLFGYALFLTYIFLGYGGKTDFISLFKFIGFSLLFSLVGALCGLAGTYIGYSLGVLIRKKEHISD
jgi:hypothetical protein